MDAAFACLAMYETFCVYQEENTSGEKFCFAFVVVVLLQRDFFIVNNVKVSMHNYSGRSSTR